MLGKMTSKTQITIPKKIIEKIPDVNHVEIGYKDGVVVLKPVRIFDTNLDRIRSKMKKLGLKEDSVAEAIRWARSKK